MERKGKEEESLLVGGDGKGNGGGSYKRVIDW